MSQKFKKIIALALAAACLLTLAACTDNGSGDDEKKFKVAYIMPGPSAYFAPMNKGADKAAEDYGIELVHTVPLNLFPEECAWILPFTTPTAATPIVISC